MGKNFMLLFLKVYGLGEVIAFLTNAGACQGHCIWTA